MYLGSPKHEQPIKHHLTQVVWRKRTWHKTLCVLSNYSLLCESCVTHGGVVEDPVFVGYDTASLGGRFIRRKHSTVMFNGLGVTVPWKTPKLYLLIHARVKSMFFSLNKNYTGLNRYSNNISSIKRHSNQVITSIRIQIDRWTGRHGETLCNF